MIMQSAMLLGACSTFETVIPNAEIPASTITPTVPAAGAIPTPSSVPSVMPQPSPTTSSAPFRLIAVLDPNLAGRLQGLRTQSNDRVWVIASEGISEWQNGSWSSLPVPTDVAVRDALFTQSGDYWLVTREGLYRLQDGDWVSVSPMEMGMPLPEEIDFVVFYTLAVDASEQVWVGRCDWVGPGPVGGNLRWYDGLAWHGAAAPADGGCVLALAIDDAGGVWAGVDDAIWYHDQDAGTWTEYPLPETGESYRFGFVTDLAIDSDRVPWPYLAPCGGASCDIAAGHRFRILGDAWDPVGEMNGSPQKLVFDGQGVGWLLTGTRLYRLEDHLAGAPPVAEELEVWAISVDPEGQVWVVGQWADEPMALWVIEPRE